MKKLDHNVAVITGGSSGIGLATAKLFVQEGASVVIVGRDVDRLAAAARDIGGDVRTVSADIGTLAGIDFVVSTVLRAHGHIDVLFANAGTSDAPPLFETNEADFERMMDVNVKGVFFLFTRAFPLLTVGASVIFTSSVAHHKGRPGDPLYSAAKAAVRSFGRTMAMDNQVLAKKVRVNVISPGAVQTPLTRQDSFEMEQAINAYIASAVPMGRWGHAEEIARAALFLASSDSSYMTGGELMIDGGLGQT
jgi:NAD(P)-dependent dehydrogenase (short-subunit alcohol dehydrogenase family)